MVLIETSPSSSSVCAISANLSASPTTLASFSVGRVRMHMTYALRLILTSLANLLGTGYNLSPAPKGVCGVRLFESEESEHDIHMGFASM
jgi:hypothetical protein